MRSEELNLELAVNLLKAIRDKDFDYMLSMFPKGIEYKGYKFTKEEHFTNWDNYEEYMKYYAGAQDMIIKKCLDKVIELLSDK